ncbi:MAG: glycosyltransferase family 1 protein, partial [Clostridia bacterium]|nr:glycosyltransferase family 1 protein [Clostridia bacterium]
MTKNILIINTVPAGFNGITGVILNYVRETCRTVRCDFVLCSGAEEAVRAKLESFGGKLFVPPCSRRKHPVLYSAWLKRLLRHRHYDVVHVHGNSGTMFFDIHAAARAGVPVRIAHCHSTSCRFLLAHRLLKPFLNRELTHAAACSEAAGKWLFNGPFTVLPNGIDSQKYAYSEQTRGRYRDALDLNGRFVIGHVGYMEEVKNHMFLLRVLRKLLERGCIVRLLLIGDGTLRPEIERYIEENGLSDAVLLLGKRSDTAELYQCMDAFVLPSLYEGLPLTLVEAQASGLPCIVSETVTREADITGTLQYLGIGNG